MNKYYKELIKLNAKIAGKLISAYYSQLYLAHTVIFVDSENVEKYRECIEQYYKEADELRKQKEDLKRYYK